MRALRQWRADNQLFSGNIKNKIYKNGLNYKEERYLENKKKILPTYWN